MIKTQILTTGVNKRQLVRAMTNKKFIENNKDTLKSICESLKNNQELDANRLTEIIDEVKPNA